MNRGADAVKRASGARRSYRICDRIALSGARVRAGNIDPRFRGDHGDCQI